MLLPLLVREDEERLLCILAFFYLLLSIVVFDKFHYGVHVGSCYFLLAILAQKQFHVLLAVLEKVFCQYGRTHGVPANGEVLGDVRCRRHTAVAFQRVMGTGTLVHSLGSMKPIPLTLRLTL